MSIHGRINLYREVMLISLKFPNSIPLQVENLLLDLTLEILLACMTAQLMGYFIPGLSFN